MEKIRIEKNIFIPMPVTIVGTLVGDKPNFMTVGWASRANAQPPMISVGISKNHLTPSGIKQNQTFSVCFPRADMVEITDFCGLVSGKKNDKSKIFDVFYGDTKTAPMIKECPLCLECTLVQAVELPTNFIFIGEIVGGYSEEKYLTKNSPDFKKIDSLILTMPDNSYWKIGEYVGKAWSIGANFKRS